MRDIAGVVILAALLAGCGIGSHTDTSAAVSRVLIRENGRTVTTYELRGDGRVLSSATEARYGILVTRTYSYDAANQLVSVTRETPATAPRTMAIRDETDQTVASRVARTVKSAGDTTLSVQYLYAKDGAVEGIVETDSNGNIQAKGARD